MSDAGMGWVPRNGWTGGLGRLGPSRLGRAQLLDVHFNQIEIGVANRLAHQAAIDGFGLLETAQLEIFVGRRATSAPIEIFAFRTTALDAALDLPAKAAKGRAGRYLGDRAFREIAEQEVVV